MTTVSIGTAAPGWPASGAVVDDDRLHLISRNTDRTIVAEVDITDLSLIRQRTLPAGDGAWGLTVAPDGVYAGLFGARATGNLYRITQSSLGAVAGISVDYIWDLATSRTGSVFGVTTLPSIVFEYNPSTGRATDRGILAANQQPRTCVVRSNRLVVGGANRGRAFLVDATLTGGGVRNILPDRLSVDDTVYCSAVIGDNRLAVGTGGNARDMPAISVFDPSSPADAVIARLPREALVDTVTSSGNSIYATARPSGALYRLDLDSQRLFRLDVPVPMSETRDLHVSGRSVIGASADGSVWRYDTSRDQTTRRDPQQLGLGLRPQRGQSICAGPARVHVGGSFSVTRHNRAAGTTTTRFVPGEPKAMVDVGDTTYMAIYPIGEIWSWAADQPRPTRLTQLDSDQIRPISLVHLGQLDALVCTTTDDGARSVLNTIDPVTGRVDKIVNPLGPQALAGLTTSGSTIYVGGSGTSPSVAAFDATTGEVLWTARNVIPDGGFILGLQLVSGRLCVSTSRGWFTTIELQSLSVARPVRVATLGGQLRRDGSNVLLATGDALLRLNPTTRAATPVETNLDGGFWNWPPMDTDPAGSAWVMRGLDLAHT